MSRCSDSMRIEELRKEIEELCGNCDRPDKEELGKIILSSMTLGFNEGLKAPTIEPKRGEWIDTDKKYCGSTVYACSECKSEIDEMPTFYEKPMYKWCPYCGAEMRGKGDDSNNI